MSLKRKAQKRYPHIRTGIVGAGYIAAFHVRAIRAIDNVRLVAVCDRNAHIAQEFGRKHGIPAYDSLEVMLEQQQLDAIHLLTPPDHHYAVANAALKAGLHVFVEKPMCTSLEEADSLVESAAAAEKLLRVNHNTTYSKAYERLRRAIHTRELGPIDYACFNHFAELGFIRMGPFDNWMLRDPGNVFFEIGSHLISQLVDLLGVPDQISTTIDRFSSLPGGQEVYRRWRVKAKLENTAIDLNIDLSPGFAQRAIFVRGLLGTATVDFDADLCIIDKRTPLDVDFDRYLRARRHISQIRSQSRKTVVDYILSKAGLRTKGNPYELSIANSIRAFYTELLGKHSDSRMRLSSARDIVAICSKVVAAAKIAAPKKPVRSITSLTKTPNILVLGGAGFIGRRLLEELLRDGSIVRVASRAPIAAGLERLGEGRVEVVQADMRSNDDLNRILNGVDRVFHLATSDAKTWEEYQEREVRPAQALAEACLVHGVKRLVYTGTIDSYYSGRHAGTITEQTPLDPGITRRNYYARAKAEIEQTLGLLHERDGLPVVIVRPGIVIGPGGNPFHWGVGKWLSEGVCQVWGDGYNKLPFVLVDDVATGLAKSAQAVGIEGRSYNLVGLPMLSARDYLRELQRIANMRIDTDFRPIWRFFLEDLAKWSIKKMTAHPDSARIPSFRDWDSRRHHPLYDCRRASAELQWKPCGDIEGMIALGIGGSISRWLAMRN